MLTFEVWDRRCVFSCWKPFSVFQSVVGRLITAVLFCVDASSDLPHFSCPELVNKYAVMERLDFLYYLRHGRPSFAFGTFLVQQLVKSKSPKQL